MRNISRGTFGVLPEATTGKTIARKPDILDVLLRMSAREAKEFMAQLEKDKEQPAVTPAPKAKSKLDAKYDISDKPIGMVFVC